MGPDPIASATAESDEPQHDAEGTSTMPSSGPTGKHMNLQLNVLQEASAGTASAPSKQTSDADNTTELTPGSRRGVRFPSNDDQLRDYEPVPTLSEADLKQFWQETYYKKCPLRQLNQYSNVFFV